LKREAKERGDKLPGGTGAQNTSKRSQQVDTETEEESAPAFTGCVICFALGKDLHQYMSHTEKRCYNKKKYEKQDPMALLTSLAEKSFAERSKAPGGSHNQPQAPRNERADRRGQTPQGQAAQQQIHSMPQMQPQGFRDQCDSYSQPNMTMQQSSGEFLYTWQLQSMENPMQSAPSIYNSGQFFQPTGQQSMSRHANLSQTMAQTCHKVLEKDHKFNTLSIDLDQIRWCCKWLHKVKFLDKSIDNIQLRLIKEC
jgi:hypothetical protein